MKVCLYARISTSDKDQDPMTQLLPLRNFVTNQEWQIIREYIDRAPATDLYHRTAWKDLLNDASKKRFDLLLVWRMNRWKIIHQGSCWKALLRALMSFTVPTSARVSSADYGKPP